MTPRAWLLFALSSVIWGVPYFFIKVAVSEGTPPAFVAWSRIALAAALLLPVAWRRGALRGLAGRVGAVLAYSACEIALPFMLIAAGEVYVTSSLTAILIATMPLLVALLSALLWPAERVRGFRLLGLLIGFGGVVALFGVDIAGKPNEFLGAGLVLAATLGYAVAVMIVSRRLVDLDPVGPVAAALALSAIALLPAAIARWPHHLSGRALGSIIVLGAVCTALGLIIFFQLIAVAGASRASVITYINPLVAVVVGVLLYGEHLGIASFVGLLMILVGSWLSTGGALRGDVDEA